MKKYLFFIIFFLSGYIYLYSVSNQVYKNDSNSYIYDKIDYNNNISLKNTASYNSNIVEERDLVKNDERVSSNNSFNLSAETYILGLNILVTVVIAIFGFFLALNIVNGNINVKNAKKLINETNFELQDIRKSKDELINDIINKITFDKISKEANNVYLNAVRDNLDNKLNEDNPSSEIVYYNLTELVNCDDIELLKTISKCMGKFINDPEIIEKCQAIIENISKKHSIIEEHK